MRRWRRMNRSYWKRREGLRYYRVVKELLEAVSPGESILDVGCADTPIATWGTFAKRHTVDLRTDPKLEGVESHVGDFLEWDPPGRFSVVTCLQCLEHLEHGEVRRFSGKLQRIADVLVVSVPWKWPAGAAPSHRLDPIDFTRFFWMMRGSEHLRFFQVVKDRKLERAVACFSAEDLPL
jgi:hypothetical protein